MSREQPEVGRVGPAGLQSRISGGDALLLVDVREPAERDLARIVASPPTVELAIPIGAIGERLDAVVEAARGRPVIVYCHHGQRSLAVASWLVANHLADVWNLEGGIDAWSRQVDPSVLRY